MLKATSTYDPVSNPDNARERRNVVLSQMLKYNYINRNDYQKYIEIPLNLKTNSSDEQEAMGSYIRAAVRRWLKPWAEANNVDMYADGLRIYTTIDSRMQRYAEEAVEEQMKQLQKRFIPHWQGPRSEEHTSEIQSLMRISYAVFCL